MTAPAFSRIASIWLLAHSLLCMGATNTAAAEDGVAQTYVYKQVGELAIKADVYQPATTTASPRPIVVWVHGGAMINGSRQGTPKAMHGPLVERGCVIVSIDYRLAPETKLPELVADIEDAFRWIREKGPELFHADPKRIAVFGGSAGGYLTLVTGYRVEPRPRALVALWGYGDLVGPWAVEQSPHARHQKGALSPEESKRLAAGPPVADSRDRQGDGGAFYQQARRSGTWAQALTGWNPRTEPEKFFPYMPLKNVTEAYPPTLLIHGDADTDVPYEQSTLMVAEFKKHGVEHRLISFPGAEHGLQGAKPEEVQKAYAEAVEFLWRHLQ